jgi:hypothetical protein
VKVARSFQRPIQGLAFLACLCAISWLKAESPPSPSSAAASASVSASTASPPPAPEPSADSPPPNPNPNRNPESASPPPTPQAPSPAPAKELAPEESPLLEESRAISDVHPNKHSALLSSGPYQLEGGPLLGYATRNVQSNQEGVSYNATAVWGLNIRMSLFSFLRVSARYLLGFHGLNLSPNALRSGGQQFKPADGVRFTTLTGLIHPTWNIAPRWHAWATLGIGWGIINFPAIQVDPPEGPTIRTRRGVFVHAPLGFGVGFDILPYLTLSFDGVYSPAFSQTGDLYEDSVFVDQNGSRKTAGPVPKLSGSLENWFVLSFAL